MSDQFKDEIVLEQLSLGEMRANKKRVKEVLDYYWKFYSELAGQRKNIQDELLSILSRDAIGPVEEKDWQRANKIKYSLHPLCVVGSLNSPTGGRFNISKKLNEINFPSFPALYAAEDRETAEFELLCQDNSEAELSNYDFALTKKQSISVSRISFKLDKCFDLRETKKLKRFVNKIKGFTISPDLKKMAKQLGLDTPGMVTLPSQLKETLLTPDWRDWPMQFDVPANPQIFGQLLTAAGIQGILYPSKMTGRDTVAIFTRNFENSDSWVEYEDDLLVSAVPKKIGASNYGMAEMTPKQLGAKLLSEEAEEPGNLH
ncbi:MAG: hypothetical protein CL678_03725 [Bdellovibrionaceae bacterium]|nr:hypothetical protein [Pseudobdellovibrionaceae bacterium]|tara:strand:+ start:481 stop:1428 length:948 start_codon:yes stop_codon:yes gene_type:complete